MFVTFLHNLTKPESLHRETGWATAVAFLRLGEPAVMCAPLSLKQLEQNGTESHILSWLLHYKLNPMSIISGIRFKPAVGRKFIAAWLGKVSIPITFQLAQIVIQVFWEKTDFCNSSWLCFQALKKSTLANHRSFQRESVPIGCSFSGGSCQSLANSDQTSN